MCVSLDVSLCLTHSLCSLASWFLHSLSATESCSKFFLSENRSVSGLHFAGLVRLSSLIKIGLHFAGLVHLSFLNFQIHGVEAVACKAAPVGVANACGIHIHAGTTCEDAAAVGGHFFDATSISADPWSPITCIANRYGSAVGYGTLSTPSVL